MIETISRLPEGYQEVEYIESSGTQYIDTGVKPNQDTGVTIDFQLPNVSGWQCIFGAANSRQDTDEYAIWHSGTNFAFYYASTNVTVGATATTRHQLVCSKNSLSIDGTAYSSPAYTNFTTNYNLILCAMNYAGNINSYFARVKLYSAKIYANGILVRDFIPCKNVNGVVGLWDNVNNQFYTNSGSGTFTAGRDVGHIVIASGGVIPMQYALRRRMMVKCDSEDKFKFKYTGNYTDNRDKNGIGPVRFLSNGTLTVLSGTATVSAYILGAGGGGVRKPSSSKSASGGGGGFQTVDVELSPGTYKIVIGTGGAGRLAKDDSQNVIGGTGGTTTAFGYRSTGGGGGESYAYNATGGSGGSPHGKSGSVGQKPGGSPNGGRSDGQFDSANSGRNGYVEITFS